MHLKWYGLEMNQLIKSIGFIEHRLNTFILKKKSRYLTMNWAINLFKQFI